MKLLLDTHVLLWWLADDATLKQSARGLIGDAQNSVFVSAVCVWEIRIKQSLGKLDVPEDFKEVLAREPFLFLDVTADHAHAIADLPALHRDPFDRMLIAQARVERLTVITHDPRFEGYEIEVIRA